MGTGGRSPFKKFEVGDGPCIRPPNSSRSSVFVCAAKYELTKQRCHEGIVCSEVEPFWQEEGHIRYIISDLQ